GILQPDETAWVVAWIAAARIGALTVPLNTFDRPRELGRTLRHTDVQLLLGRRHFLSRDYAADLESCAPDLAGQKNSAPLFTPSLPMLRHVWLVGDGVPSWAGTAGDLMRMGHEGADTVDLAAIEAEVAPADPVVIVSTSGST